MPLVVQDRQLIAAIEDPHDFATLEALAHVTGYRVLPRVAPELRIYYYIERYYGVARPARFIKFGDSPRGDDGAVDAGLPAPPLPGLPPVPAAPVAAPGPAPAPAQRSARDVAQMFDDSEALELEAEDLIDTLDADDAAPAEAAPIAPVAAVAPRPMAPAEPAPTARRRSRPTSRCASSRRATDRNRIVEVMLGYARGDVRRRGRVHRARQPRVRLERDRRPPRPRQRRAPADPARRAVGDPGGDRAPRPACSTARVTPSTVNSYLYKVLGCAEPAVRDRRRDRDRQAHRQRALRPRPTR